MDPEIRMRLKEGLLIAEVRERDALLALKNSGWLDLGVFTHDAGDSAGDSAGESGAHHG